jgi:myo-inositol catabolism protein IolC
MMTDGTSPSLGLPSAAAPLFILAMDQRDSFERTLFGVTGAPTADQLASMRAAKSLIFAAVQTVPGTQPADSRLGVLVDEQLGAEVARSARAAGFELAMPVEVSGVDRLAFEYGDDFGKHIEAFDPDWVKVLVRFNPADPAELQQAQTATLRRLNDWVAANRRRWLLELLVPATREQLTAHEDQALYDEEARPELTARVITSLTASGVHPSIWKLEGYETTRGAQLVLDTIKSSAGPPCECIVLGRNAPRSQLDHWLDVAAPLPGYAGFAIGRSIWNEPLADYLAGKQDQSATQQRIGDRYRDYIGEYVAAGIGARGAAPTRAEPPPGELSWLTPEREATIRKAVTGADPRGTMLPAWMCQTLLAEVDALRKQQRSG